MTTDNEKDNQYNKPINSQEFNAHEFLIGFLEEIMKNIE
jgi:hypothetical protein